MGYFSNGSEGMSYEAKYCNNCVHQENCTVLLLHHLHNYEDCNNEKSYLHVLIPRTKDGLYNEKCTMFHPTQPEDSRGVHCGLCMKMYTRQEYSEHIGDCK
jgi:hypothetical protein